MEEDFRQDGEARRRLLERIDLSDGLFLELWDMSREMYSARHLARVEAKVKVPIEERFLGSNPEGLDELGEEFGEYVEYGHTLEKIFISEEDLEETLGAMCDEFKETALRYLKSERFAARFLARRLEELREKKKLDRLMGRA